MIDLDTDSNDRVSNVTAGESTIQPIRLSERSRKTIKNVALGTVWTL